MGIHDRSGLRWGIGLAACTALISGVAVFLNANGVKQVPDAAVYTTLKNGVAAMVLIGLLAAMPSSRRALPALSGRQWLTLAAIGVVGGSVPFLLFFGGLAQASAPSAAFIHKTLFIWVAILAVPLLGERLGWPQLAALAVLLGSQVLLVNPQGIAWGSGETMIAAATLLWSAEVILARRLLPAIPSLVGGSARLGLGMVVLVGYLAFTGRLTAIGAVSAEGWFWVLLTGVILAGYVATWYAALKRAPATLVTAVLVAAAPVTATLTAISSGAMPAPPVALGHGLVLLGAGVLAWFGLRTARPGAATAATA
ncbi:MAG TPA: DMT family transporter [Candidatus Limnocylindria bacterium]